MSQFIQKFDSVPQFWQFIRGLNSDDLLIELIQNELDANASHTTITFTPDRLICQGDGEPVSDDGWDRLAYVMGAGDQVERKHYRIGIKNHGLKACFRLGNDIIVRSDGKKMIQTLYKDGDSSHPSPGTLREPEADQDAPLSGSSVEVPYRQRPVAVTKGENLTLEVPDEDFLEDLFRNACENLPSRLMGIVRPSARDQYILCLSHYSLGSVEIHWRAKRGQRISGRGRRVFLMFRRECEMSSDAIAIASTTLYEQACTFRVLFPIGKTKEIPEFFRRDGRSFLAEISWITNKSGTPKSTKGTRRYPIGYDTTSESALTGVGVHFSAPFISDAERHGTTQTDSLNAYIDSACKDAFVDLMASYLLHRHGGRVMELYLQDSTNIDDELLNDMINRTVERRAVPLRDKTRRVKNRSKRIKLGPRQLSNGDSRRIVLPMFTWDKQRISPALAEICPDNEDQIDGTVPNAILEYLGKSCYASVSGLDADVITFDESDAVERLQPQLEARYFPWNDESEWQAALGDPSVARFYLDVVHHMILEGELESEAELRDQAYLPDKSMVARPLADMFSAVNLPPDLGKSNRVPILHPRLQTHRLLKKRAWKPRLFRLSDYLDIAQLATASFSERESF